MDFFPKYFFLHLSDLKEDFRVETEDINVALGDEAVLNCSPPKGHPAPIITWKKDGQLLQLLESGDKRCPICICSHHLKRMLQHFVNKLNAPSTSKKDIAVGPKKGNLLTLDQTY